MPKTDPVEEVKVIIDDLADEQGDDNDSPSEDEPVVATEADADPVVAESEESVEVEADTPDTDSEPVHEAEAVEVEEVVEVAQAKTTVWACGLNFSGMRQLIDAQENSYRGRPHYPFSPELRESMLNATESCRNKASCVEVIKRMAEKSVTKAQLTRKGG